MRFFSERLCRITSFFRRPLWDRVCRCEIDPLCAKIDDAPILTQNIYAEEPDLFASARGIERIRGERQLRRMDRKSSELEAGRRGYGRSRLGAADIDGPDSA